MHKKLSKVNIAIVIVSVIILDQLTKYITKTSLELGESVHVIGNFFRFTYVENPGMAFGLRIDNNYLFLTLSLAAAFLVFYYLYKLRNEHWPLQLAISLITAGAIGNLSDRFIRGSVVDFMDFEFFDIIIPSFELFGINFSGYDLTRWPVFNVADMAVSGGMIIIITYMTFFGDPLKKSPTERQSQTTHAG